MTVRIDCPKCETRLKVDRGKIGKAIECPSCKNKFAIERNSVECPDCHAMLGPGSLVCNHCQYDFAKRRKRKPREAQAYNEQGIPAFAQGPTTTKKALPRVTWNEILFTPFSIDEVLPDALAISAWCLVWVIVINILGFVNILGPFGWVICASLLAALIRIWLITIDFDLSKVVLIGAGAYIFSLIATLILVRVARAYGGFDEAEAQRQIGGIIMLVFIDSLFMFAFVGMWLKLLAYVWGKYFAICDRAAFGAIMTRLHVGDGLDLWLGVAINVMTAIPFAPGLFIVGAGLVADDQSKITTGSIMILLALLFAYFYVPMAIGVAAIKRTANPIVVLEWIRRSGIDYVLFLFGIVPLHALFIGLVVLVVGLASGTVLGGFLLAGAMAPLAELKGIAFVGVMLAYAGIFILSLIVGQYPAVVMATSLGKFLRLKEPSIGWYER